MPLVGTAGHVDHGKSLLIHGLTGRDPDRWEEEKRRGLTIDLGFAWTTLPDGTEVSFVDVPGHEKFLRNMLAGIEAVDVALFVVAADEGWMPQSEEHLAVLDLLGVDKGVIALTKSDLVDAEVLELARIEITDRLAGTSLAEAPVVAVSSVTGEGLETLVAELQVVVAQTHPIDLGRPRLWVDRSFSAVGAGTVVTGSLLDGSFRVDDSVEVYPTDKTGRVRGVQSHEQALDRVGPGRRVALNLSGVERAEISRGHMVGLPAHWDSSSRFAVEMRTARYVAELEQRGAYQLHIGSSAHRVEIVGLAENRAVLKTPRPIPMAVGDPFILRDTGRKLVVAGGRILDPAPGPTRRALTAVGSIDPAASPVEIATALLALRGHDLAARMAAHTRGGRPRHAKSVDGLLLADWAFAELTARARRLVEEEHESHPLRVGLSIATLAKRLGVESRIAEAVVEEAADLERIGPDVALVGREVELGPDAIARWEQARTALAGGLDVPNLGELGLDVELVHYQIRRGRLIRISDDLVLLPEQAEEVRRAVRRMTGAFTVADFRDAIGLSRKYAVPFLEWADSEGLTVRRGDTRTVR